ncbi:zinc transport system substrate-binding protein [Peptoniphilus asaccharolyticus DSM 20463]|uniref:Zinc transport system substrate-binding protein n=1 Tax=Peptoniphilus asaccharolyticus DSM 20463 TaxID=573058 RepID=A0A1W1VAI3_PEPAS|nr:zinc ABC transporter substrate-binding protein [Peptoniphilus asaccharolyticus]MBL7575714.1 zinc ABC transporter substrate-binding protein [Peptoniphilus asaccharolyticus]SMB90368.1 zinc transport system substrate-binding protein [Peptoniphilus asaccharolyticus DSM 20463]
MKKKLLSFCFIICLLIISGCSKKEVKDDKPVIYTSFYPIHELVSQVAGDTVTVKSFMPLDKDPHFWEPSPKSMRDLADADLLVVNGANMEKWVDQVRENLPNLDILVLSESVNLITYKGAAAMGDFQYMAHTQQKAGEEYKIEFGHTHENSMRIALFKRNNETEDELIKKGKKIMEQKGEIIHQRSLIEVEDSKVYTIEMGHESGLVTYKLPSDGDWVFVSDRISENILSYDLLDSNNEKLNEEVILAGSSSSLDKITYDPHSWMSVINAKKYLNTIFDELVKKYPEHERVYKRNKLKSIDALTDLEFEFKEKFKNKKNDHFLTAHNAYGYIARDFGLTQFALSDLVSSESPSLKTIRTAINFANTYGIDTIFYEYGGDSKSAKSLAEEIHGKAEGLVSMEFASNIDDLENRDYLSLMRMNLEKIYEAVK